MASIRDLKKDLNWLTYEVLSDCFIAKIIRGDKNDEVEAIMHTVLNERNDLISRVHEAKKVKDAKEKKAQFKAIEKDMFGSADNAFKSLSELVK